MFHIYLFNTFLERRCLRLLLQHAPFELLLSVFLTIYTYTYIFCMFYLLFYRFFIVYWWMEEQQSENFVAIKLLNLKLSRVDQRFSVTNVYFALVWLLLLFLTSFVYFISNYFSYLSLLLHFFFLLLVYFPSIQPVAFIVIASSSRFNHSVPHGEWHFQTSSSFD